jgi:hypothetical protein
VRPFGRSGFYEAIVAGGGEAGVRIEERNHQVYIVGVKLKAKQVQTYKPEVLKAQGGF